MIVAQCQPVKSASVLANDVDRSSPQLFVLGCW